MAVHLTKVTTFFCALTHMLIYSHIEYVAAGKLTNLVIVQDLKYVLK